ncbi:MAG: SUMF1/EgtB/PvdO family nonheme iron enzyme [Bryobacteraceae bacterium]
MPLASGTHPGTIPALEEARTLTDTLFRILRGDDAWYERPIPERHRLIFYLGHLEAFDWNLIGAGCFERDSVHGSLDRLFAFGIDPDPGQLPDDRASDWPSIEETRRYSAAVRDHLDPLLMKTPEELLHVALEHRLMHAETLTYQLHNLAYELKIPQPRPPAPRSAANGRHERMVEVPAGIASLGKRRGESFGWDNEFEQVGITVAAFGVRKYKVTNGEYLDFVRAGGPAPHYWIERRGEWLYRGIFSEIPLPLSWPVYVTLEQARAYATWAGGQLPSEAQWHRAALGTKEDGEREYPWGDSPPDLSRGNFGFTSWDPVAVTATPEGDSAFGVSQLTGNGWEWTSTVFEPFPGFEPFPFYPGYSVNSFDGAHFVLKGGSPVTAARLLRRTFRNWFRPAYPYVYATFRYVET